MNKTKHITKQPRVERKHSFPRDPRQNLNSIYSFPSFLEEIQEVSNEDAYNIYDFLSSIQEDNYPYYNLEDDEDDSPTAPLRCRSNMELINKQYLQKMGEKIDQSHLKRIKFSSQIQVKLYFEQDAVEKLIECEKYEEIIKDGSQMQEQAME